MQAVVGRRATIKIAYSIDANKNVVSLGSYRARKAQRTASVNGRTARVAIAA